MMPRLASIDDAALAAARNAAPAVFATPLAQRFTVWGTAATFIALTAYCLITFDVSPARVWLGLSKLVEVFGHMLPPTSGGAHWEFAAAMLQTIGMAFAGTFIAAVLALPLGMLCAKNVVANRIARTLFRRSSDVLRGVDQLIWALIFVRAVGLGPLAGVIAIVLSDTGTLAKLYSEAIENVEKKQIEGVRACGAGRLLAMRFGILPQVLPVMLSNALYLFESNTRSATILGIVGAGGIGFYLSDRIRALHWDEASFILVLILVSVYLIDMLSKWIRMRLIRGAQA